jgi:hypothetical protein
MYIVFHAKNVGGINQKRSYNCMQILIKILWVKLGTFAYTYNGSHWVAVNNDFSGVGGNILCYPLKYMLCI